MRTLIVATLTLFTLALPANATVDPINFSPGFLENLTCGHLHFGQKLSVNPFSLPAGKTSNIGARETTPSKDSERQIMVQKQLYECQPDVIQALWEVIDQLPTFERNNALTRLKGARDTWLLNAHVKYTGGVETVFNATVPRTYIVGDSEYPWTYPKNGILLMRQVLADLDKYHIVIPKLHQPLRDMLVLNISMEGQPVQNTVVGNQTSYFADPMTDQDKINIVTTLTAKHAEAGAAGLCAASGGVACGDVSALNAEVKALEIEATVLHGIPLISPYTTGAVVGMTFTDRCLSVQRAHLAYHKWMLEVVMNGHTIQGFQDGWRAMFGHSLIHMNRRLGLIFPQTVDRNVWVPKSVYDFSVAPVPGVMDGVCDPFAHMDGPPPPPPPDDPGSGTGAAADVTKTFTSANNDPGPKFNVEVPPYICQRQAGGTSVLRILLRGGVMRSIPIANPARNTPFTLRCEKTASMVNLYLNGVLKVSVPAHG